MERVRTVSKGVLKAKMLEYFRQVEQTGEDLIVTDHRVPILKITALTKKRKRVEDVFHNAQGKVKYYEDILTPASSELVSDA